MFTYIYHEKSTVHVGEYTIHTWQFFVTFLGCLSDPFGRLSDLQLGDRKVTLNPLVYMFHPQKNESGFFCSESKRSLRTDPFTLDFLFTFLFTFPNCYKYVFCWNIFHRNLNDS